MKTKILLKLSLITSLIGVFLLVIFSNNLEPKTTDIAEINEKMLDEWVKINGRVVNEVYINKSRLTIFTVYDGTAAINCISRKNLKLNSKSIEVIGKIINYNDEIEIDVKTIKIK